MLNKRRVYLDAAAGASANPSSPHEEGRAARAMLDDAREKIARLVEAKADDVVFTGGATEANALAVLGLSRAKQGGPARILYLPSAHASIVENVRRAVREGASAVPLPVKDRRVDRAALAALLAEGADLIAMEAVCGETGVVWNTREVRSLLDELAGRAGPRRGGALLHVDASQAPWTEKLARAHFGADLLTLDASKVSVARGIGCLIAPRTLPLAALYEGGGQERALRPGSEAYLLAKIFADDLAKAAAGRDAFRTKALDARRGLMERLLSGIPDALVNEGPSPDEQAPHILNISLIGRDTDYLVALLDEAGFAVSTKSACETDSPEGSRAVMALYGSEERAAATLRISWGPEVRERDLTRFADALIRAVRFMDAPAP